MPLLCIRMLRQGDSKSEPGPGYTVGMCWDEKGMEINKTQALKRKARLAGGIAQW